MPEVASVFGKAGRAETATDPAPLEMFETTIQFKPRDQWRPGMTPDKLVEELDRSGQGPRPDQRLGAADPQPHRHARHRHQEPDRGEGVRRQPGRTRPRRPREIEGVAKAVPGVSSALAERLTGGRYIDVDIDRAAAARYGLNIADVQAIVSGAIGGEDVGQTVEGLARYPINVRYPREVRDSLEALRALPILTPSMQQITLGTVADIRIADGPPMLKTENGRPTTWVYVDVRGRDLTSVVADLQRPWRRRSRSRPASASPIRASSNFCSGRWSG